MTTCELMHTDVGSMSMPHEQRLEKKWCAGVTCVRGSLSCDTGVLAGGRELVMTKSGRN